MHQENNSNGFLAILKVLSAVKGIVVKGFPSITQVIGFADRISFLIVLLLIVEAKIYDFRVLFSIEDINIFFSGFLIDRNDVLFSICILVVIGLVAVTARYACFEWISWNDEYKKANWIAASLTAVECIELCLSICLMMYSFLFLIDSLRGAVAELEWYSLLIFTYIAIRELGRMIRGIFTRDKNFFLPKTS